MDAHSSLVPRPLVFQCCTLGVAWVRGYVHSSLKRWDIHPTLQQRQTLKLIGNESSTRTRDYSGNSDEIPVETPQVEPSGGEPPPTQPLPLDAPILIMHPFRGDMLSLLTLGTKGVARKKI